MGWNLLENNVRGTLDTGIDADDTAMNVTLDAGSKSYPATPSADTPMYLTLSLADNPMVNEIVKVEAVSGANVTTMVRAQRDTLAQTWAAGSRVSLNLHAEDIEARQATFSSAGTVGAPSVTFTEFVVATAHLLPSKRRRPAIPGAPSALPVVFIVQAMLLCPDASHTSPTQTSRMTCVACECSFERTIS